MRRRLHAHNQPQRRRSHALEKLAPKRHRDAVARRGQPTWPHHLLPPDTALTPSRGAGGSASKANGKAASKQSSTEVEVHSVAVGVKNGAAVESTTADGV